MSVIVRINDEITLFTKGADVVIYQRLDRSQDHQCNTQTQSLLDQYGRLGLRTLCLTKRVSSLHVLYII